MQKYAAYQKFTLKLHINWQWKNGKIYFEQIVATTEKQGRNQHDIVKQLSYY